MASRHKHTAEEEEVRLVLKGFRREATVSDPVKAGADQPLLLLLMDRGIHGGRQG